MSDEMTKREETTTRTGNAAKLREALEEIAKKEELFQRYLNNDQYARAEDAIGFLYEASCAARAALAAHPRNCDRFATEEEAYKAWQKSRGWKEDANERYGYGAAWAFTTWLFAPAKQEGGE